MTTKFMSWKWILKKDDFSQWYQEGERATQEACAPVVASLQSENGMSCPGLNCDNPCPMFVGGKDAEAQIQDHTQENAQSTQDEQHILNHLRTSPSLVHAFSMSSAVSANAGKADEKSTGSKTQADSIDGFRPLDAQVTSCFPSFCNFLQGPQEVQEFKKY